MKQRIKYIESDSCGISGFILTSLDQSDFDDMAMAGSGMVIAHDILEHIHPEPNCAQRYTELIALGAALFVRAEWQTKHGHTVEGMVDSDITRILSDAYQSGDYLPLPKYAHKKVSIDCADRLEYIFQNVNYSKFLSESDSDNDKESFAYYLDSIRKARLLMSTGYALAKRKYKSELTGYDLFTGIERAVDGLHPDYDGQEWIIEYSIKNRSVNITEVYPEDYY